MNESLLKKKRRNVWDVFLCRGKITERYERRRTYNNFLSTIKIIVVTWQKKKY